jgi:hypothetical protein
MIKNSIFSCIYFINLAQKRKDFEKELQKALAKKWPGLEKSVKNNEKSGSFEMIIFFL